MRRSSVALSPLSQRRGEGARIANGIVVDSVFDQPVYGAEPLREKRVLLVPGEIGDPLQGYVYAIEERFLLIASVEYAIRTGGMRTLPVQRAGISSRHSEIFESQGRCARFADRSNRWPGYTS